MQGGYTRHCFFFAYLWTDFSAHKKANNNSLFEGERLWERQFWKTTHFVLSPLQANCNVLKCAPLKITFDNLLNAIIYYTFYLAGDIAWLAPRENLLTKFISPKGGQGGGRRTTEKNMKNCSLLSSFLHQVFCRCRKVSILFRFRKSFQV